MSLRTNTLALCLTCFAAPVMAFDSCLSGLWRADLNDLAHILATQMNGSASYSSGNVNMVIADGGAVEIIVNNLVLNVSVPGSPAMDVSVTGFSRGNISADGGAWTLTAGDYELVGSADVMGQHMTIPFSSATGMFGGGLGTYGCTSSGLAFESTGSTPRMPRKWTRM